MQRNTWIASALFIAMCVGGVTTLVSQASLASRRTADGDGDRTRAGWTSLDPGRSESGEFGELLPLGLRRGREMELRARGGGDAPKAPVLRLR
jgi:hypothetical protein